MSKWWFNSCWRFGTTTKTIDSFKIQYFFHKSCFVKSKLMTDAFLIRILLAFLKNSVGSDQTKQMISKISKNVSRVLRTSRLQLFSIALLHNVLGIYHFGKEHKFLFHLTLGLIPSQSDALFWRKGKPAWLSTKAVWDLTIDIHKTEH